MNLPDAGDVAAQVGKLRWWSCDKVGNKTVPPVADPPQDVLTFWQISLSETEYKNNMQGSTITLLKKVKGIITHAANILKK